jgi:hypothetical protein
MSTVVEKTGEMLPLKTNKSVRIIKKDDGYIVVCLRAEMTPGSYATISVEPETWYTVDVRCTRFGVGLPGLWIGTIKKKTLFYGNFFNDYNPSYLKRNFFSGPFRTLLLGILVKNAFPRSGYFINQFSYELAKDVNEPDTNTPKKIKEDSNLADLEELKQAKSKSVEEKVEDHQDQPETPESYGVENQDHEEISTDDMLETLKKAKIAAEEITRDDTEYLTPEPQDGATGLSKMPGLPNEIELHLPETPVQALPVLRTLELPPPVDNHIQESEETSVSDADNLSPVLAQPNPLYDALLLPNGAEEDFDASDLSDPEDDNVADHQDQHDQHEAPTNDKGESVNTLQLTEEVKVAPLIKPANFVYRIKEQNADFNMTVEINSYSSFRNRRIYPISFGIPEDQVLDYMPEKTRDFFPQKIGEDPIETYKNDPERYWEDLKASRFLMISKQGVGWETPLIVEALSQGCIPLFIEDVPEKSFQFIPKRFLDGVRNAKGVHVGWLDHNLFAADGYQRVVNYLLQYTKKHLTTKAIANYMLATTGKEVRKILVLGFGQSEGDYLLQQSLIHGLKEVLGGDNVVDIPKLDTLYKKTIKARMYREGIPYCNTLKDHNVERSNLEDRIREHEFDLVIVMGCFTEKDRSRLKQEEGCFPYGANIEEHYDSSEILFVDGSEDPLKTTKSVKQFIHRGLFFRREYDGSVE